MKYLLLILMLALTLSARGQINETNIPVATSVSPGDMVRIVYNASPNIANGKTRLVTVTNLGKAIQTGLGGSNSYGAFVPARSAGPVEAACYTAIRTGSANTGATSANERHWINVNNQSRIRQSGTVSNFVSYWIFKPTNLLTFTYEIWRPSGTNWSQVYSQDFLSAMSSNVLVTNIPAIPWEVQEGDATGFGCTAASPPGTFLRSEPDSTNIFATYYITSSAPGTNNYAWSINATDTKYYPIKVYLKQTPDIAYIGDSISAGHPSNYSCIENISKLSLTNNMPYFVGQAIGGTWQNLGSVAQTTTNINLRFTNDVLLLKPRVAVIEGGINDVSTGTGTLPGYLYNLSNMVSAAIASNVYPVVLCIPPWTGGTLTQMTNVETWNLAASNMLSVKFPTTATWVDVRPWVGTNRAAGPVGNLWDIVAAYDPGDGTHYNAAGYARLAAGLCAGPLLPFRQALVVAPNGVAFPSGTPITPSAALLYSGGPRIWNSNNVLYASWSVDGVSVTSKQLAP